MGLGVSAVREESTLFQLEAHAGGPSETFRFGELAKPLVVCKEGLVANPAVAVRLGPVVGKVTDTSAVILLEVTRACEVTCHLVPIVEGASPQKREFGPLQEEQLGSLTFARDGVCSLCHPMEAGRPRAFNMTGLEPDFLYLAVFSDVNQEDMFHRTARLRTFPEHEQCKRLKIAALSGNHPGALPEGHESTWSRLLELGEQDLILHMGNSIDIPTAMREAEHILTDYSSYKIGVRRQLEVHACNALREAYYEAWNSEEVKEYLAKAGSHLMIWGSGDLPLDAEPPVASEQEDAPPRISPVDQQAARRCALTVYREYQRQLWQAGPSFVTGGRPSPETTIEEWHFHQYGKIGVFLADTKGNQLMADAGLRHPRVGEEQTQALLSSKQWDALLHVLNNEEMKVLVLVCDTPFVMDEPEEAIRLERHDQRLRYQWPTRQAEISKLFEELFEWKHSQYPYREVVLLAGGSQVGFTSDIRDHKLGLSISMVVASPMLDTVHSFVSKKEGMISRRFSYSHRPYPGQWNFASVEIELETRSLKPAVEVQLVGVSAPPSACGHDERRAAAREAVAAAREAVAASRTVSSAGGGSKSPRTLVPVVAERSPQAAGSSSDKPR